MKYGIHWFRRDLRIAGNAAFQEQYRRCGKKVIGVFFFDEKFLSRPDFSHNRFQFFLDTLTSLKKELKAIGSDLLVFNMIPQEGFPHILEKMKAHKIDVPEYITWNRDYEPFAKKRDADIEKILDGYEINFEHFRDHLVIEPKELKKDDGTTYKVYTPFSRKWLKMFSEPTFQKRVSSQAQGLTYLRKLEKGDLDRIFSFSWKKLLNSKFKLEDSLKTYQEENSKKVDIEIPKAGSLEAFKKLKSFKTKLDNYGDKRDFPNEKATSNLSMYLKNGSLSIPQIIHYFKLKPYLKKESGRDIFFSELIWREFYYHILHRYPRVEKESFIPKYSKIKWANDKKLFQAWKNGTTGFPIVDAGMRQLNSTGQMHNRVRMIVASFLVKDLLVDWRWGEKYFMEKLLDGDLAANNGGWQWAASTGCDPQPYFRIFNPWTQGKKFDPEGKYIKEFIPELSEEDPKNLHQPILDHESYPKPIVEHAVQREKALNLFKSV